MISSSKKTINSCRICNSSSFSDLLNIARFPLHFGAIPPEEKKNVQQYPLAIAICNDCGLVQQLNLLDEEILNRVYDATYYNCPSPVTTGMGISEIEKFYSFFKKNNLNKGKLLEIACFDGYLLKKFQDDGWDVYGCDPSPITKNARELLRFDKVKIEYFNDKTYPPSSFDVIIFRNLLEHIYDLHKFLNSVSVSLRDSGRIFIDVPNIKQYEKYGGLGSFFHQHVSYFSIETLANLLRNHGFGIERFYEGDPNLFLQAVKTNDEKQFILDNELNGVELNNFVKNNNSLHNQINKYFSDPKNNKIAIFGASALTTHILSLLNSEQKNKIRYIFDNDNVKYNKQLFGSKVSISNPDDIHGSDFDSILINTYFFTSEIRLQLKQYGIDNGKIVSINDFLLRDE